MISKEERLLEWLSDCDVLTDVPLFGWLNEHDGCCAIVPIPNDRSVAYIDSDFRPVTFDFMLEITLTGSGDNDCVNTDNMLRVTEWQDWIDEQEMKGNYPDFGENCCCYELSNLSETPQIAQITETGQTIYQFPARLQYLEVRKENE